MTFCSLCADGWVYVPVLLFSVENKRMDTKGAKQWGVVVVVV